MPGYRHQAGEGFSGWILIDGLGYGQNAEVWRTARSGETAAIKLVSNTDPAWGAGPRFRREIRTLRELGYHPGILPLLDYKLPDDPGEQSWFVMPVAVPVRRTLAGQDSHAALEAAAAVGETLDHLAAEHDIAHRDIKPDNLYRYAGSWAIGDFGLVQDPRDGHLTAPERRWLGSRDFIAPEMITKPFDADGKLADVYSLAKTLWCLLKAVVAPPAGELRRRDSGCRLQDVLPASQARFLELLLEAATSQDPEDRPSMRRLAGELRALLAGGCGAWPPPGVVLSDAIPPDLQALGPGERARVQRTLMLLGHPLADGILQPVRVDDPDLGAVSAVWTETGTTIAYDEVSPGLRTVLSVDRAANLDPEEFGPW